MTGAIFLETLRTAWRAALYAAIGLGLFGMYAMFLLPDTAGLSGFVKLMEAMPREMLQLAGIEDPAIIGTPEGFIGFAFFTYGAVMVSIYAVFAGLSITANDDDAGVMNMLLALPLPRWRVVIERAAAQAVFAVVIAMVGWGSLAAVGSFNPTAAALDPGTLLQASLAFVPVMLVVMMVTALLGVVIRRRSVAGAAAGAFVAISYLLDTVGGAAGTGLGDALERASIFAYFDGTALASSGLDTAMVVVLTAVALLLTAVTVGLFERRDVSS